MKLCVTIENGVKLNALSIVLLQMQLIKCCKTGKEFSLASRADCLTEIKQTDG